MKIKCNLFSLFQGWVPLSWLCHTTVHDTFCSIRQLPVDIVYMCACMCVWMQMSDQTQMRFFHINWKFPFLEQHETNIIIMENMDPNPEINYGSKLKSKSFVSVLLEPNCWFVFTRKPRVVNSPNINCLLSKQLLLPESEMAVNHTGI